MKINPGIRKFLSVIVGMMVPIALILTGVRLLLTNAFVQIEYRLPNFPPDTYGMSQEERMKWAPLAVDYLLNAEDISFLGEQRFDNGVPLYNERELSHMEDVKNLTGAALRTWYVSLVILIGVGVWAWRGDWFEELKQMLGTGGQVTVILLGTIILVLALNFNQLFTWFHRVFFEGDTWIFPYSDTLIRLFPLPFWRDAFAVVGVLAFGSGAGLWYFWGRRRVNSTKD